ncbi:hypothetical protein HMPREF9124_2218 [Oribacterium sp. oral taxon 108 str. F0425]|nr:hypothetical protein HMPREF9124_2218 [Oribacterium sp. oral taxon 108 str. F0425]
MKIWNVYRSRLIAPTISLTAFRLSLHSESLESGLFVDINNF